MSAFRALRQLTASSSRILATRAATRSALPAFRSAAVPASRAFSVSARRFGEGASELLYLWLAVYEVFGSED